MSYYNDDSGRFCCDQKCRQGRECPLTAPVQSDSEDDAGPLSWAERAQIGLGAIFIAAVVAAFVCWKLAP